MVARAGLRVRLAVRASSEDQGAADRRVGSRNEDQSPHLWMSGAGNWVGVEML